MSFSLSKNDFKTKGKNSFLGGEPRRTLSLCNEAQSVVVVVVVVVVLDARHIVILSKKGCPPGKGKSRLKKNELFSSSSREAQKSSFYASFSSVVHRKRNKAYYLFLPHDALFFSLSLSL